MAPEVIAHERYSEKADVYSFAILLVEIYTNLVPYSSPDHRALSPWQLAKEITQNGLRPDHHSLPISIAQLAFDCWNENPKLRPSFSEIKLRLKRLDKLDLQLPFAIIDPPNNNLINLNSSNNSNNNNNNLNNSNNSNNNFNIYGRGEKRETSVESDSLSDESDFIIDKELKLDYTSPLVIN